MIRSPWLGVLAVLVAGVIGYVMSDGAGGAAQRIESVTVTIRPTRDTGAGWDFGGGAPDPKVTVLQGDTTLATCELKDTLTPTCAVGASIDTAKGPVRVTVVDIDSSDSDDVGELVVDLGQPTTAGSGALQAVAAKMSGGTAGSTSAWQRFRPLWIALAAGLCIAIGLAMHRRRGA